LGTGENFSLSEKLHQFFHVGQSVNQVAASVERNTEGLEWINPGLVIHLIGDLSQKIIIDSIIPLLILSQIGQYFLPLKLTFYCLFFILI
jgi:hypothetical protein